MFEVDCHRLDRRVHEDDEVAAEVEDLGAELLNNCEVCARI
jgi:hypothetical protein